MGQHGNWKKEGYHFKITEQDGFYQVLGFNKENEKISEALFRIASDVIGWTEIVPEHSSLSVTSVKVQADHQRKGIATEMYRLIEDVTGKTIIDGKVMKTEDAKQFWKSRAKL